MEAADDVARDRRLSEAFEQAVAREHEAIAAHGRAADMHEASAVRLDATAANDTDPEVAARRREQADIERARAQAARMRAAAARKRLSDEGVADALPDGAV